MNHVQFGLLTEGTTDQAALPPLIDRGIEHLLRNRRLVPFEWNIDAQAGKSSDVGIASALESNRYDVICVHRDGAGKSQEMRQGVIDVSDRVVPLVPVRELEAWILADIEAVRRATRASSGTTLVSRTPSQCESASDPKGCFREALHACTRVEPRLGTPDMVEWYGLVAAEIDPSLLLALPSFALFVDDLERGIARLGWTKRAR